jgi:membrane protein DedA with SNARE-associated domain
VLPIARNVASYAAGIAAIPPKVFYPAMVSGSVIWCVTVLAVGDTVGSHYRSILRVGSRSVLVAGALVVVGAIGWLAWSWLRRRQTRDRTGP